MKFGKDLNEISFPMEHIRPESSGRCVYMKFFFSDQAFILTICVHVNIASGKTNLA